MKWVNSCGVVNHLEINDGVVTQAEESQPFIDRAVLDKCNAIRSLRASVKSGGVQHAASIPMLNWSLWRREWMKSHRDMDWHTFEAIKLNNRDFSHLRTGWTRGTNKKL